MRTPRVVHLLALLGLLLGGLLATVPRPAAAQAEACFRETGNCVRGRLLDYWQQHGALAINGYPLSDERRELLEDGKEYTVQYFERVRLEYHPENRPPYDILLGQFGRRVILGSRPAQPQLVPTSPSPGSAYFPETGHNLSGRFLDYWQLNGGLARNGFPLTEERRETLEDGREYTVQYFERVRLELHPENAPPYDVLLGFFGRRVERAQFGGANSAVDLFQQALAPAAPLAGASYFPETGHNLGGAFRDYWRANGELAQFGFPITEERREQLEDGNQYTVQYFERARLEYHPENAAPYDILLGQFGRRIAREATLLTGAFGRVYLADQGVRDRLGAPAEAAAAMAGATQEFERGRMFYLSAARTTYWGGFAPVIYILTGGVQSGSLLSYVTQLEWPDTWREGEEAGGGPAPQAGLFLPRRGFGKVWRLGSGLVSPGIGEPSSDVRDRLGYATTADETGYQLLVQRFDGGLLLSTPDGRFVYAVFANRVSNGSALTATYARYEVPAAGVRGTLTLAVSCGTTPERTGITNHTNATLDLGQFRLTSVVAPIAGVEPLTLTGSLPPGANATFDTGAGATTLVLTRRNIYNNDYPNEGARLTTPHGTLTVLCRAGVGTLTIAP